MSDATDNKQSHVSAGGRLQRMVICFRWNWRWTAFWSVWNKESKGVPLLLWMALVGLVAGVMQIVMVILFPLRWLLVDPIKTGLTCTEKQAENIEKVLGR